MLKMVAIYAAIFFVVMLLAAAFDGEGSLTLTNVLVAGLGACLVAPLAWLRYDWLAEFHRKRSLRKRQNDKIK